MKVRPPTSRLFPYTTLFRSYLNAKGALTYTDIAGDPVLYGNLPPREISMKDVFTRRQVAIQNRVASNIGERKSGSAGMPRPRSYAVFCSTKKNIRQLCTPPK